MKHSLQVLHNSWIESEIVFDGPSLPILEIGLKYGNDKIPRAWVMMNKSQAEQLILVLRRQLSEM
jgi:hypothetical protein